MTVDSLNKQEQFSDFAPNTLYQQHIELKKYSKWNIQSAKYS
jgi:hypothetical protein